MLKSKCYKFKKEILLIDVTIDDEFGNINLNEFYSPIPGMEHSYYQVPWMEQYFAVDRDEKICKTWDEPPKDTKPVRILFFLYYVYDNQEKVVKTPYGDIPLSFDVKVPTSIKKVIDFDEVD